MISMSGRAFAVVLLLAACLTGSAAHSLHGGDCGVGHPELMHLTHPKADGLPKNAQAYTAYETVPIANGAQQGRRLVDQTYPTNGTSFVTVEEADMLGLTRPLRIKFLWELTNVDEAIDSNQCRTVGQQVTTDFGQTMLCEAKHIVNATTLEVVQKRARWAAARLGSLLRLKPVQDDITATPAAFGDYAGVLPATSSDTDLVVVMTLHPEPTGALAGYAYCKQTDQHNRCTVGFFNWCPNVIDTTNSDAANVIAGERRTAVHELIHVLGGILPGNHFIDDSGAARPQEQVWVQEQDSDYYDKPVLRIITPRVVAKVQEHYGCDTMRGMQVEDQPTGVGAHWEARLMGPEVMSYGSGTGEGYVSDLTLAFLEDTEQYRANYSAAGPLVDFGVDADDSFQADSLAFVSTAGETKVGEPQAWAPGALRWGRDGGCDFVYGSAGRWDEIAFPSTQTARYTCDNPSNAREYACSYDNRMSAVCTVGEVTATEAEFSCLRRPGESTECQLNTFVPSLPLMYQYLGKNRGGFNDAMDYAPVRVGYWNCKHKQIDSGDTSFFEGGVSQSFGSLLGNAESDISLFGGQEQCPTCRCFQSSLVDITSGSINPGFTRYGLCYRSNCYAKDGLQFAIKGQLGGSFWYGCPKEGGKLYIPGFTGAFHCPQAENFCKFEDISGIKYNEVDRTREFAFWGVVIGLPVLFLLSLCLCPGFRNKVVRCIFCGKRGKKAPPVVIRRDPRKVRRAKKALQFMNGLLGLAALAAIGWSGYTLYLGGAVSQSLMVIGVIVLILSLLGFFGGRRDDNELLLAYFYACAIIVLAIIFVIVLAFTFDDLLTNFVDSNWGSLQAYFPELLARSNTTEEAVKQAEELALANAHIAGGISAGILLFLLLSLFFSVRLITVQLLFKSVLSIVNTVLLLTGLFVLYLGSNGIKVVQGLTSQLAAYAVLATGGFLTVVALIGTLGVQRRSKRMVLIFALLDYFATVLVISGAYFSYVLADVLRGYVSTMPDQDIAEVGAVLGIASSFNREEVLTLLTDDLRMVGLALFLVVFVLLIGLLAGVMSYRTLAYSPRASAGPKRAAGPRKLDLRDVPPIPQGFPLPAGRPGTPHAATVSPRKAAPAVLTKSAK